MAPHLTLVSNGHGEDAIGAALGRELLSQRAGLEIAAFPLVGNGAAYREAGLTTLGPCRAMPSGGLMLHSRANFIADLRAGWLGLAGAQVRELTGHRTDVLLVVGDLFAQLLAAGISSKARFVYQSLVSVLQRAERPPPLNRLAMERLTYPERFLMRHRADRVYVRDEASAAWLRSRGVPHAVFLGNPAVDAVVDAVVDPVVDAQDSNAGATGDRIALFPGSRAHAGRSLETMLGVVAEAGQDAALAWALPNPPTPSGWTWRVGGTPRSQLGTLVHPNATVVVYDRNVAAALRGARLALGTTGTAVEQAAAAGVPVVSFPVPPEHTRDFLTGQKRLLGDALLVVEADPSAIRAAVDRLLRDDAHHARAASAGRQRMGAAGGSRAIVEDLLARAASLGAI